MSSRHGKSRWALAAKVGGPRRRFADIERSESSAGLRVFGSRYVRMVEDNSFLDFAKDGDSFQRGGRVKSRFA